MVAKGSVWKVLLLLTVCVGVVAAVALVYEQQETPASLTLTYDADSWKDINSTQILAQCK